MPLTFDDIERVFAHRGSRQYSGEPVTQVEHALQTAWLGEQAGADDELVTAALLHDLGHLLTDTGSTPTLRGLDDRHQDAALPFLRGVFADRVLAAIAMHVDAKRYLCRVRTGYFETLSADSKRSLALQGEVFSAEQAEAFIALPAASDAVSVRLWDDAAKAPGLATPPLAHFLRRAARIALARP